MRILHIAAHMGGGIGSAYAGLGACGQEQRVLLLEPPQDQTTLDKVQSAGFQIIQGTENPCIERELEWADAVVFSWHHHPALTKFLHDFPAVPIRSILWCHVSGNYFPAISAGLLRSFDQCIFATPFSLELPQVQALGTEYLQRHCGVVYGLNDLSRFTRIKRRPHERYTIGYVGTLGFCKLHPALVDFYGVAGMSDARFMLVGAPSTKEELLSAAERRGMAGQLQFCGQLPNVEPALAQMDVFSYLLNPQHFGATENALLEAMAAGLPVVALDQCVERHIIRNGETGLLVHSPEEYGNAVRYLRENPEKASLIGAHARADIMKRYEIEENRRRFLAACRRADAGEKHLHHFGEFFTGEPADWFLSAVDADRQCFEEGRVQDAGLIFREKTKGSPAHYHTHFPENHRLTQWTEQINCLKRKTDL
ncbi:glycosyltransferase [Colidextribacter sp. OB.20]|nr:glycosyltransferase [Colidextribacter sp. OB.20]